MITRGNEKNKLAPRNMNLFFTNKTCGTELNKPPEREIKGFTESHDVASIISYIVCNDSEDTLMETFRITTQ